MASVHEQLTEQFRRWEQRGRGWRVFGEPVYPEPPFVPFDEHYQPETPVIDDGQRPTFLSSLFRKATTGTEPPPIIDEPDEPEPTPLVRGKLIELHTSLPNDLDISREAFEQFFLSLSLCREPVAFELVGSAERVSVQFVAGEHDASLVRRQLQAYFSDAVFIPRESVLEQTWITCSGEEELAVEFGLAREFMFPLASGQLDPFVGIIGALSELKKNELGLFQILWQPVRNAWAESIMRSVTHDDGKPFFVNSPELAKAAQTKVSRPLFAAVVRIAAKAGTFERVMQIACDMAGSLRVFSDPHGNELIPLRNDDYPFYDHIDDVLFRQSRRSGMLLNGNELTGFVHLPSSSVRSSVLERDSGKTKAAPNIVCNTSGLLLGTNTHFGESTEVRLTPEQRTRHCHIIGASGTGKSTLLFNLIQQDIENGEGLAVLDPHGDLVDKILGVIPAERINDVVLVDPSDEEFSIGFNILQAHSDHEKTLLASDLVSVFQRLSTSWGDQMQSVFQNAILAFLNSSRGGTLADLRRFLVEPAFRNEFLKSVSDPNVLYYWHKGFAHLSGNKSIGPVLTRLEMFLAQRPIAHMVSQPQNRLDFGEIMDTGKIFLAKLPEGLLGRENSYLLGALLASKFQQLVMARQAKKIAARRDFRIFVDEFANFITPSIAEILSGARKYRIGLVLAHHELHQLQRSPEVESAVMAHPYTRIVFRVSDSDAKKLAEGFSFFEAGDLKNLETGHAVCRVERSDFDFNLSVPLPELSDEAAMAEWQQTVVDASRKTYGTPRAEVEAMLRQAWEIEPPKPATTKSKLPPDEPSKPDVPKPPLSPTAFTPHPTKPASPAAESPQAPPPTIPPASESPKPSEVPKDTTGSEKKIAESAVNKPANEVVSKPAERREPESGRASAPRDLGKGGHQHKAIQQRIKKAAEELGFRCVIEFSLAGRQSVDISLERDNQKIACEISFTTTIDHEVGNVAKCLKAGFSNVAVICLDEERLRKIAAAVSGCLGADEASRVGCFQPDQFLAHLKTMPVEVPKEKVTMRRGRKVTRKISQLSIAEQKEKEAAMVRAIAASMRRE